MAQSVTIAQVLRSSKCSWLSTRVSL